MTLSSLLNNEQPSISDRGEHGSFHHHHPTWSGGHSHKGKDSALSALTLLAFLFFLNILQQCLQNQLQNQAPITVMMTTSTTTTTEGQRLKREGIKGEVGDKSSEIIKQPNGIKTVNGAGTIANWFSKFCNRDKIFMREGISRVCDLIYSKQDDACIKGECAGVDNDKA